MLNGLSRRAGMLQRQHERLGGVLHVDEVAPLAAVLEHQGRPVVQQARREDGEHAGVGVRERLAGAVDVEQAQRRAFHAVVGRRASASAAPARTCRAHRPRPASAACVSGVGSGVSGRPLSSSGSQEPVSDLTGLATVSCSPPSASR